MITNATYVLALLKEDPVKEQLLIHVVIAKAYNTQHHLFKVFFHGISDWMEGEVLFENLHGHISIAIRPGN